MKPTAIITAAMLITLLISTSATAQDAGHDATDSLRRAYYAATDSKQKAEICMKIGCEAYEPDTVIKYSQLALQHIGITDLDGMAQSYSSLGWAHFIKRDFTQSLDKYLRAAALFERAQKHEELTTTYINIAACNRYLNRYKDMWNYLYRGLDKAQQSRDTLNICYAYSEIADVYQNQKMGNIAQETLLKALDLAKKTGNYAEMGVYAKQLGAIASPEETDIEGVKVAKNWAMKAEEYFSKADLDQYYEAIRYNNYAEIIYCYLTLAKFYYDDRYIDSSRHYVELYDQYAYEISPLEDNQATSIHIHARQLMYERKYRQAINILKKCLNTATQEDVSYLANITYSLLAESYEKIGDYNNALRYFDKYDKAQQSLSGEDAVAQTAAYNARFRIEQEKRNIETEKQMALEKQREAQRQKQRTFAAIIAIGFAVVSIIAIITISLLATRRANRNIANRNAKILKQQAKIELQKRELQETSEKIKQSMSYARRIQMAATSSQDEISAVFPDNLVIYRPQEIVSGDWYLVKQTEHEKYLAVGGSSEHGVPGAMASMLVVDSIKEVVGKIPAGGKASPSEILAQVEQKVHNSIGAGIEIAISFCIISDDNTMRFAAVNNDAILVRGDSAETLISHKREDTEIQLIEGDYLFLYSNNTRRLMSSNGNAPATICKTLATHHADGQQVAIDAITGGHPQTGDITIVGIGI